MSNYSHEDKSLKSSQEGLEEALWVACWIPAVAICHVSVFPPFSEHQPHFGTADILMSFPPHLQPCSPPWPHHLAEKFRTNIVLSHHCPHNLNSLLADFPSPSTCSSGCHPCMQTLALCHPRPALPQTELFFLDISFLYTHICAFCCMAKQCLSPTASSVSSIPKSSKGARNKQKTLKSSFSHSMGLIYFV